MFPNPEGSVGGKAYRSLEQLVACAVEDFDEDFEDEVGGPLGVDPEEFIDELVGDWTPVEPEHLAQLVAADPSLDGPRAPLDGDIEAQDAVADAVGARLRAALRERLAARIG